MNKDTWSPKDFESHLDMFWLNRSLEKFYLDINSKSFKEEEKQDLAEWIVDCHIAYYKILEDFLRSVASKEKENQNKGIKYDTKAPTKEKVKLIAKMKRYKEEVARIVDSYFTLVTHLVEDQLLGEERYQDASSILRSPKNREFYSDIIPDYPKSGEEWRWRLPIDQNHEKRVAESFNKREKVTESLLNTWERCQNG
jgi:hypothetical protein